MTETKQLVERDENTIVVDRAKDFWGRHGRTIMIASAAIILLCGGYLAYKYLVKQPQQEKAELAIFKAEEYWRADSLKTALNGDGVNAGFLTVISKFGSTDAGNRARFYAGDTYLKLGDFKNAEKHLQDFSTDSKLVQARAYKLLGDAHAEQGENKDALEAYKKAARHFKDDDINSSEYLFIAAYFADRVLKDREEAISLFKELQKEYPRSERGFEAEKYLAQLGVYTTK